MENCCSSFFKNKFKSGKLVLDGKTVSDKIELCRTFSIYFTNIVLYLKILSIHEDVPHIRGKHDPLLAATKITLFNIKQREFNRFVSFNNIYENKVRKITKNLHVRKICQGSDIPTKIIKLLR